MALHTFTTGLPHLDKYIDEPQPRDSVLFFTSSENVWHDIVRALVSCESSVPVLYVSIDNSLQRFISEAKKHHIFQLPSKKITSSSLLSSLKRFVSSKPKQSLLVLDELSAWKKLLGNEHRVVEFFQGLVNYLEQRSSLLFTAALKSSLSLNSLAELKDTATVCLDIIQQREKVYFFPLTLRGRYKPGTLLPLQLNADDLTRGHTPHSSGDMDIQAVAERVDEVQRSLVAPDERYRRFFHDLVEPAVLFDLRGEYREFNLKAQQLLNRSSEELRVAHPLSFVRSGQKFRLLRSLAELRRKKKTVIKLDIVKGSTSLPAEIHFQNLGDALVLAVIHDISHRLLGEEQLQRLIEEYERFCESHPFPLLLFQNNTVLYANPAFFQILRRDKTDDLLGKGLKQIFDSHSVKALQKVLREQTELHRSTTEVTLVRADGSSARCLAKISTTIFRGKPCTQICLLDISEMKDRIERLTKSESTYRTLIEQAPQAVAIVERNCINQCNRAFVEMFNLPSADQIIGKPYTTVEGEGAGDWLSEKNGKRSSAKNDAIVHETAIQRTDGAASNLHIVALPFHEQPERFMLFYHDITEQKHSAEELKQRHREIALLKEVSYSVLGTTELQKLLHASLHKIMDVLAWGIGATYLLDATAKEFHLAHHRNFPAELLTKFSSLPLEEGIGGFLAKTQEPQFIRIDRYPSYLPYKALFKLQQFRKLCFAPLLAHEKVVGILFLGAKSSAREPMFAHDLLAMLGNQLGLAISNAHVLRNLQETAERFQQLMSTSPAALYTQAANGTIEFISDSVESLLGYSPKEFRRNKSLWLSIMHPDDKRILLERTANLNDLEPSSASEYRMLPRGRAVHKWVRDVVKVERDSDGVVIRIYGTLSDVTDYREQVHTLAEVGTFANSIVSNLDVGAVAFDSHLTCTYWNTSMEQMTGRRGKDAVGKSAMDILPRFEEQGLKKLLGNVLLGEPRASVTLRHQISKSKGDCDLWLRFSPLHDSRGSISGVVGTISDITEQKKREDELRESEQLLRNIIDTMGDIFIITDLQGGILQTNKSFERILGYSRAEAFSQAFPYPWLLDEEMGRYVLWIASLREKNWLHDFDMTWKAKDGQLFPMSLSTTLLRNSIGEPIAMLNIARDITERKRLTKDLESRNRQIEMINRIISRANETIDFDEIFSTVIEEIHSVTPVDMVNVGIVSEDGKLIHVYADSGQTFAKKGATIPMQQTVSQFVIRDQKTIIIDDLLEEGHRGTLISTAKGLRSQISLPITLKGRIVGTLNIASRNPRTFTQMHVEMFQPIAQHLGTIIDRVRLFRQVTDDSTYIHNLLNSIDNIVYTVDRYHKIREVNQAWYEFVRQCGLTPFDDYEGKNLFDVLPSETLKVTYKNVIDQLLNGTIHIFSEEYIHHFTAGDRVYQLTVASMVVDDTITGLVFTHTDITPLKETEAKLKEHNEQLLALNEISALISTSRDINEMLHSAVPLFKKTTQSDAVIVYLTDDESGDLLAKDTVIGALDLFYKNPHPFTGQDRQVLTLVGNQLGSAIENTRLYSELRSQIERLTTLYELSQQLTSTLEVEQVLRVVAENTQRIVPFEELTISVFDDDASAKQMFEYHVKADEDGILRITKSAEAVTIGIERAEWQVVLNRQPYRNPESSLMSVPMLSKESILGIMTVRQAMDQAYTIATQRALESIANLSAIALEKAKLYEATLRISEEIQRRNKELDDFTYVVSHDLKEPIISVEGFSRILQMDYQDTIHQDGKEYLDSIVGATTRMKGLIDDLLMLSRVSRPSEAFKPIPIKEVIDEIRTDMVFTIRQKGVNLLVPDNLPIVWGNETQLKVVFRNLIGNAVKFNNKPNPLVEIEFRNTENNSYLFSIRDNGIGIEKEFFEKIFVIFQRLHRREEYEGSGAGLAIVKKILEIHKGTIWVESIVGQGSTFFFTLPRATE
ncbi:MAG: PAS domain S-box protein [Ignavibacteriae bacterium]|nr:PAS domain S-box protein [Ignavibacteriota bacterium]